MGKLADEILAGAKKKGPPMKPGNAAEDAADGGADDAEETADYPGDEQSIAGDVIAANKSGDNAAMAEALKSFIEACYPQLAKG